jgi:hypothetical protein
LDDAVCAGGHEWCPHPELAPGPSPRTAIPSISRDRFPATWAVRVTPQACSAAAPPRHNQGRSSPELAEGGTRRRRTTRRNGQRPFLPSCCQGAALIPPTPFSHAGRRGAARLRRAPGSRGRPCRSTTRRNGQRPFLPSCPEGRRRQASSQLSELRLNKWCRCGVFLWVCVAAVVVVVGAVGLWAARRPDGPRFVGAFRAPPWFLLGPGDPSRHRRTPQERLVQNAEGSARSWAVPSSSIRARDAGPGGERLPRWLGTVVLV